MKALIKFSTNRSILILLVGIFILMSILAPRKFLTFSNMISMSYQLPLIAFLSIGVMISMLTGGINLAIIATANFTGIITFFILQTFAGEVTSQASILQSIIALGGGLIAALVIGAVMGYLIAYIEVGFNGLSSSVGTEINFLPQILQQISQLPLFKSFFSLKFGYTSPHDSHLYFPSP